MRQKKAIAQMAMVKKNKVGWKVVGLNFNSFLLALGAQVQ